VAETAKSKLNEAYPNAKIEVRHGYFDAALGSADNVKLLTQISEFKPQILFVGMGMPRQELWLTNHASQLPTCVTFSVGAAFDYEAGVQRAAPRWMGQLGIEWLFRLVHDPRRLFVRYCVEPWTLLPVMASDIVAALRAGRLFRKPIAPPRRKLPRDEPRTVETNPVSD
jgi:N-acetylglucosaminyldiphosphoundecaprenol N-acetyl-beta-D-mannosaminyltransferase